MWSWNLQCGRSPQDTGAWLALGPCGLCQRPTMQVTQSSFLPDFGTWMGPKPDQSTHKSCSEAKCVRENISVCQWMFPQEYHLELFSARNRFQQKMHVLKRYQWSGFQNLWILEDWRTKLRKCIYSSKVSPQLKFFVSTLPLRCHCCHHWTLRLLALNLMPLDKNLHCLIVITLLAQCSQT